MLFSTPMVQAILDGRKTQTRRVVKPQPPRDFDYLGTGTDTASGEPIFYACWEWEKFHNVKCPYGQPGDVLWVRERFRKNEMPTGSPYHYYADNDVYTNKDNERWKPSIHMPKDAARIWLEITNVRVERLQDITGDDAQSEGISPCHNHGWKDYMASVEMDCFIGNYGRTSSFQSLWQSINGKESWDANPWVWVIEFKRIEKT